MLTILGFYFLNHKLQLCFACHAYYTPIACGKGLLTILIIEKYFELKFKI